MKALFWNFVLEFLVLVLALCGDKKKKKKWTSFKSLILKSVRTWWLKRLQGIGKLL